MHDMAHFEKDGEYTFPSRPCSLKQQCSKTTKLQPYNHKTSFIFGRGRQDFRASIWQFKCSDSLKHCTKRDDK